MTSNDVIASEADAEAAGLSSAAAGSGLPADDSFDEVANRFGWLASPAIRSSFWTIFCYVATQGLRLASNVVLSRLLFPKAFGLVAMANVFVQGLQMFSDIGIGPSIIQHQRGDDARFLNTAWTIQVLRGLALAACSFLAAWPLAMFYDEPQLMPLIWIAGLCAAISGLNSTYLFTVRRSMRLASVTLLEIAAGAAGILVNCIWALFDKSVWALMAGTIVCAAVRMIYSHVLNTSTPNRLAWDRDAYRELISFGKWIFISTTITFCSMQGDRILLSRLIPWEMLGVYTLALTVALLPNVLLSTLTFSVLYPLLCQAERVNRAQLHEQLLKARGTLLTFGLLLVLAVGTGADLFFRVLYDSRYQAAIWMTQLMCVSVWVMVLNTTLETSLLALGDSRSAAGCGLVKFLSVMAAAFVGFQLFAVPGFILGVGVGTAVGQAALLGALSRHGIYVVRQDLQYTALIAIAGAAATASGVVRHGELAVLVVALAIASVRFAKTRQGQSLLRLARGDRGQPELAEPQSRTASEPPEFAPEGQVSLIE